MEIKIMSNYLGRDIDVSVNEINENGEKIRAITHDSLERIINDQLEDYSPSVEYTEVLVSLQHTVIKCCISDNVGRKITAIGESTPNSLGSSISKSYPALMAYTRAFDRAAIRYLQFPTKMMSCEELNCIESTEPISEISKDDDCSKKQDEANILGQYKLSIVGVAGKTIKELYENNRKQFDNIANNLVNSQNQKILSEANKIREYKKIMGGEG